MAGDMTVLEKAARAMCTIYDADPDDLVGYPKRARWEQHKQEAERTLSAALGLTPEQLAQPAGSLVVVPVEPTESMWVAGEKAMREFIAEAEANNGEVEFLRQPLCSLLIGYRAMLAARPGAGREGG